MGLDVPCTKFKLQMVSKTNETIMLIKFNAFNVGDIFIASNFVQGEYCLVPEKLKYQHVAENLALPKK